MRTLGIDDVDRFRALTRQMERYGHTIRIVRVHDHAAKWLGERCFCNPLGARTGRRAF